MAVHIEAMFAQKYLILKQIIPALDFTFALKCLHVYTEQISRLQKQSVKHMDSAYDFLIRASIAILSQNFQKVLTYHRKEVLRMHEKLLKSFVSHALLFVTEGCQVRDLVEILISKRIAANIYELLAKSSDKFSKAFLHDYQELNMRHFIIGPGISHKDGRTSTTCLLGRNQLRRHEGKEGLSGQDNSAERRQKVQQALMDKKNAHDDQQVIGQHDDGRMDYRPLHNVVSDEFVRERHGPTFLLRLEVNAEEVRRKKGMTYISEAFNTVTRSWHVKLDVSEAGSVSVYVLERGAVVEETEN